MKTEMDVFLIPRNKVLCRNKVDLPHACTLAVDHLSLYLISYPLSRLYIQLPIHCPLYMYLWYFGITVLLVVKWAFHMVSG